MSFSFGRSPPRLPGSGTEDALDPGHVVPATVFEADLAVGPNGLEAKGTVEPDAGFIGKRHAGHGKVISTLGEAGKQRLIEGAPAPGPAAPHLHVDAHLASPSVGRAVPEGNTVGVSDDDAGLLQ